MHKEHLFSFLFSTGSGFTNIPLFSLTGVRDVTTAAPAGYQYFAYQYDPDRG